MGTDGIRQYINIHGTPQELYDLLPFDEHRNGDTTWKKCDGVTWFKPHRDDSTITLTVSLHNAPHAESRAGKGYWFDAYRD